MPKESDLQEIFNGVLAGSTLKIFFRDHKHYESIRTNLQRKFRRYRELIAELGGDDPFDGRFLKCSWNSSDVAGTFKLEDAAKRSNVPGRTYSVETL